MRFFSSSGLGYFLAFCATILWSTVFLLARVLANVLSPVELAFWRWFLAFLFILPFCIFSVQKYFALIRQYFWMMAGAGILGFSIFSLLIFEAGKTTSATNLALIAASAPIFMAFLSRIFLYEKFSRCQVAGLTVAVSGVLILVLKGDFRQLLNLSFTMGDIWMLLAAVLFAIYSVLIRRRPVAMPQTVFMTVMLAYSFLALTPLMVYEMTSTSYRFPDLTMMGVLVFIALVPSLIGFLLWNQSIERIGASRAGMMYYSIPLFSSLEASFFLNESISVSQVAGGLLIIGGILFSSMSVLRLKHV